MVKRSKIPHWVKLIDRKLRRVSGMCYMNLIQKFYPGIFDHFYYEGENIVGEPYGTYMGALKPFIKFCEKHNLTFSIQSGAKHHPDCIRIIVGPDKTLDLIQKLKDLAKKEVEV